MRMEQPSTIPFPGEPGRQGYALEGLYVPGADGNGGVLVAPPHPLYGGSVLNPVVTEIALRCQTLQITSLRFNWRGVGASAGVSSGEAADAQADYGAALGFFRECVEGPICAAGYSWGAAAAVAAAAGDPSVRRLLLVAPPHSMLDRAALEAFRGDVFLAVGEHDELAGAAELEAIAAGLAQVTFVVLNGVDHFFANGTVEFGRAVQEWLGRE